MICRSHHCERSAAMTKSIEKYQAKFVDLRWTDIYGKEQHLTLHASFLKNANFANGYLIDLAKIGDSLLHDRCFLQPDLATMVLDPFFHDTTIQVRCDIIDSVSQAAYLYDPRAILTRAEQYLKDTGIADDIYFGLSLDFFLFDNIRWKSSVDETFYKIDSEGTFWNSAKKIDGGNVGHSPHVGSGGFATSPIDCAQDVRSAISLALENLGIKVVAHYHASAGANQCRLIIDFDTLKKTADAVQIIKYVVRHVAHNYGKTATFMPKPLIAEHGSGMSCRQFLMQASNNLFIHTNTSALSELALYYLGGILKHIKALNAFTNPTTLSYKRLLAEDNRVFLAKLNHINNVELNFPDATANPYLAFAALLMAGIDGIQNKIHPKTVIKKFNDDWIELPISENLRDALNFLDHDKEFLMRHNVFAHDFIATYIDIKNKEWRLISGLVHPMEFELYYSL